MGNSMDDQVAKWVETSGRGLELRVARAFHRVGARVEPSFIYEDVRTGTSREGDVLATFEWLSPSKAAMHLEVVVECKHSANKPWVAFYDRTTPRDITNINSWVRFAHGSQVGLTEPLGDLWAARPPFDWGQVATHIVTALADDRNNPSNDAVRQVLSAAASRRDVYLKTQQEALHKPRAVVVIALVVITGPLYECRLSPSGQVELKPTDSIQLGYPREDGAPSRVWVMRENVLGQFTSDLLDRCRDASDGLARS